MNKINWRVRFKNKTCLFMFLSLIIGFVYGLLRTFEAYPLVMEHQIVHVVNQVLTFLGLVGVLVDPTTAGIGDSERAMGYSEPWDDNVEN